MGCHGSIQTRPTGDYGSGFSSRYALSSAIGEGSFGQVHVAWSLRTRKPRAVKVLDIRGDGSECPEKLAKAARHERKIWKHLGRNDHCIELLECFVERDCYFFVMDRCEASLMDRLTDVCRLGDGEQARIFREMLLGIKHLHSLRICHRDVKPNNFLLGGECKKQVKICDFGLAAALPKGGGLLKGCYGTAPYMAPEMVVETGHTLSVDIWSYGVSVYVMMYRAFPYAPKEHNSKAMKSAIKNGIPEPSYSRTWPRPATAAAEDFSRSLLRRSPSQRYNVKQALELPFLTMEPAVNERPRLVKSGSSLSSVRGAISDDSTQSGGPCRQSTRSSFDDIVNPKGSDDQLAQAPHRQLAALCIAGA